VTEDYTTSSSGCLLRDNSEGECNHPAWHVRDNAYCEWSKDDVPQACPLRVQPIVITLRLKASEGT